MDRASYNSRKCTELILASAPYIQLAVRANARYNPSEFWNGEIKYFARLPFSRLNTDTEKLQALIKAIGSVSTQNIQNYYWTCVGRAMDELGLKKFLEKIEKKIHC
jgi:hypothetical protein